jgi:hypothetical protein
VCVRSINNFHTPSVFLHFHEFVFNFNLISLFRRAGLGGGDALDLY